jgi:hypothetical protein
MFTMELLLVGIYLSVMELVLVGNILKKAGRLSVEYSILNICTPKTTRVH